MPSYEYQSFRPRVSTEEDFWILKDFCSKHQVSFSAFINCALPAMAHCIRNYTKIDGDGNPVVELNLGEITIK